MITTGDFKALQSHFPSFLVQTDLFWWVIYGNRGRILLHGFVKHLIFRSSHHHVACLSLIAMKFGQMFATFYLQIYCIYRENQNFRIVLNEWFSDVRQMSLLFLKLSFNWRHKYQWHLTFLTFWMSDWILPRVKWSYTLLHRINCNGAINILYVLDLPFHAHKWFLS